MKKIIIASSVLATSVAFAVDNKINLDGRYDFVNSKVTVGGGSPKPDDKYNSFSNGTIRINMNTVVNDSLSFRFRTRFTKSTATPSTVYYVTKDGTTNSATYNREDPNTQLDFFYADYKTSMFTFRFGKQSWVEAVGRESFISGTDLFASSQAYADYKTAFGSDYRGGLSIIHKYDLNTVTLSVSNPNSAITDTAGSSSTAGETVNTGLAYGINYSGSFMNKLVQPVLAYQSAKQNGDKDNSTTKTKDGNNTVMAFGIRSEVAGFTVDADYKQVKQANRNDTGTTSLEEKKTKSIVANVAYSINEFTPFVTYINDKYTQDVTTTANFKKTTTQVGVFYKPFADANFRYHLVYASSKKDLETSTVTTTKDTKVYAGMKLDI